MAMGHSPTASETGASRLFSAITSETSIPAASGIGSPTKYRCVPDSACADTALLAAARDTWDEAVAAGERYGYRNAQATVLGLYALPFVALGIWLGHRRFIATEPQTFRRVVLWILAGLGVAGLALAAVRYSAAT